MENNSVLEGVALLPEDIANAVIFLASDMGRCVNVSCGTDLRDGASSLLGTGR